MQSKRDTCKASLAATAENCLKTKHRTAVFLESQEATGVICPPALGAGPAEVRAGRAGRDGIALPRAAGRAGRFGIAPRGLAPAGALMSSAPAIMPHCTFNTLVEGRQAAEHIHTISTTTTQEHVQSPGHILFLNVQCKIQM